MRRSSPIAVGDGRYHQQRKAGRRQAMREIHVVHHFAAAPDRVFAALADHQAFLTAGNVRCRLQREGTAHRDGVGAVREVEGDGLRFIEDITAFDPPRHYEYVIRSMTRANGGKVPLRHERGWLDFTPEGDGTRVDWHTRIHATIPLLGPLLVEPLVARKLERAFTALLARAAARITVAPP
jgi:hypothetical protein